MISGGLTASNPILSGHAAWFTQADHACVPNASAGTIQAVVPKIGLAPRTRIRTDDDTAVFFCNFPPQNKIGELPQDIAKKITPILARKRGPVFGALQRLDMAGKIVPVLVCKCVDIFRVTQKKHARSIEDGHWVTIVQGFQAKLCSLTPSFPASIYIKPETIRLWMPTLQITFTAQLYRIQCPVIVGHTANIGAGSRSPPDIPPSSAIVVHYAWPALLKPIR